MYSYARGGVLIGLSTPLHLDRQSPQWGLLSLCAKGTHGRRISTIPMSRESSSLHVHDEILLFLLPEGLDEGETAPTHQLGLPRPIVPPMHLEHPLGIYTRR
jgi:hypothetical protein